MSRTWIIGLICWGLISFLACNPYKGMPSGTFENDWRIEQIPAYPQIESGDAAKGLAYLKGAEYIGSGIPYEYFAPFVQIEKDTILNRTGLNATMPHDFAVFEASNGEQIVGGTCFTCHAGQINGQTILGLGDSFADFRESYKTRMTMLNFFVKKKYKKNSPEREAFVPYGPLLKKMTPYVLTKNPIVSPAFRLEEGYANHRDPVDLSYHAKTSERFTKYTIASDTPPLWNVKKKNALYYNGMGRGDFTKQLMQAGMAGIQDTVQAEQIRQNFEDVLAWLNSLEAPKYPKAIDAQLAIEGQYIFESNCAKCHGTYGDDESYPNKLTALEVVQTDPIYALYLAQKSSLSDWYNKSWYANSTPKSQQLPLLGYIAPPLDGIWATAPYLHNASVPTLDALLNSSTRPTYWNRTNDSRDFNYKKVGWKYTVKGNGAAKNTFDTTLLGYSNVGHRFGDKLNETERKALIEYLKTL